MRRAIAAAALGACGCGPARGSGPLGADALMTDVRYLADPRLGGRAAGSDGEHLAAAYAADRLRELGLAPVITDVELAGGARGWNVHALLAGDGTDEVIVVGAHLDHLGRRGGELYPGADDDASGVAVVLGIAAELAPRRAELSRGVMFALFAGEEQGMVGSRAFVADPPVPLARIPAMVNLDMVGRRLHDQGVFPLAMHLVGIDRDGAVGLVGTRRHPGLRAIADAAFAAEGGEVVAAEDLPSPIDAEIERQTRGRGDSVAFEEKGIPALFFGDGESSEYHEPGDVPERLDQPLLAQRARAIARVVVELSRAPASAFAAAADEARPRKRKPPGGLYLPFGVVAGGAFAPDPSGFVGAEASLVYLGGQSLAYAGVYADAIRDVGPDITRVSVGLELGKRLFGVDAGYVMAIEDGAVVDRGGCVRFFATAALLGATLRVGRLDEAGWFVEAGVAIKYPLHLF
jgi:hypothetical protein